MIVKCDMNIQNENRIWIMIIKWYEYKHGWQDKTNTLWDLIV